MNNAGGINPTMPKAIPGQLKTAIDFAKFIIAIPKKAYIIPNTICLVILILLWGNKARKRAS